MSNDTNMSGYLDYDKFKDREIEGRAHVIEVWNYYDIPRCGTCLYEGKSYWFELAEDDYAYGRWDDPSPFKYALYDMGIIEPDVHYKPYLDREAVHVVRITVE